MSTKTQHDYQQLKVYTYLSEFPSSPNDISNHLNLSEYIVKMALGILENLGKAKRHYIDKKAYYTKILPKESIVREEYKGERLPFRYVPRPPSDICINMRYRESSELCSYPTNTEREGDAND